MREPQARSTLGTCRRFLSEALPLMVSMCVLFGLAARPLVAQIRGGGGSSRGSGWWLSGGAGSVGITDINDGATQSHWTFSTDPMWQYRATLEKASDDATSLGIAVSYGTVDLSVVPFVSTATATPRTPTTPLPAACALSCAAQSELWSLMGQFRSGGGAGFHTLFEASAGVTSLRNMHVRNATAGAIGKPTGTVDLTGTIGAGFGYPLSRHLVLALVQDFGLGLHAKTNLPDGVGRSFKIRTTRASVRIGFGN